MIPILLVLMVFGFLVLGMPIAFCLGLSTFFAFLMIGKLPLMILAQQIYFGINVYPMLAIPFFLLAGAFMNAGGMTERIIAFFNALFGRFTGALAITNCAASMFFGGVSGMAIADVSSLGAILIPSMKKAGYPSDFSVAVTASSAICGPVIPPSVPMIIYGVVAKVSVLALFLAGAIPGIILGLLLMLYSFILSKKKNFPRERKHSFAEILMVTRRSFWALIMPIFLLVGIIVGFFTITELSAFAALYGFIIGVFVYRTVPIKDMLSIFWQVAVDTGVIMFLIGMTMVFAWFLAYLKIPQTITYFFMSITTNKILILVLINLVLLGAGLFLDSTPATLILVPVFLPLIIKLGINPIHFGVIMVFNLMLGLLTPPVCIALSLGALIAKIPLSQAIRASIPFFVIGIIILIFITYVPEMTLFLPDLVFK